MNKQRFQDKATKGSELVIRKMCEMVCCDYDTFNFEQKKWWEAYQWTVETEKEFARWLNLKIRRNKTIREAITNFPELVKSDKKQRKVLIGWFLLSHGWKYKDGL